MTRNGNGSALTKWNERHGFRSELLKVSDLEIDRRVQRQGINKNKVEKIVAGYNPAALGVLTVSRRVDRSIIIIDGMHRWEATRIKSDNQGELQCHVFEGLSLAEEAQMFLDLNTTSKPTAIEQFRVSLESDSTEGQVNREIERYLGAYQWKVSGVAADSNVNAVNALQRVYALSERVGADPNLVQLTMLAITRAWGHEREGAQAAIIEALSRMFAEYGELMDLDRLVDTMKRTSPLTLLTESRQLAALTRKRQPMCIAEVLVNEYNGSLRSKARRLTDWRGR